jgi:hypothetical protein
LLIDGVPLILELKPVLKATFLFTDPVDVIDSSSLDLMLPFFLFMMMVMMMINYL